MRQDLGVSIRERTQAKTLVTFIYFLQFKKEKMGVSVRERSQDKTIGYVYSFKLCTLKESWNKALRWDFHSINIFLWDEILNPKMLGWYFNEKNCLTELKFWRLVKSQAREKTFDWIHLKIVQVGKIPCWRENIWLNSFKNCAGLALPMPTEKRGFKTLKVC